MKKTKKKEETPAKSEAGASKEANKAPMPVFLEIAMTLSRLLVVLLGAATVFLSLMNGSNLFTVLLRGGAALLAGGFYVWLVNWIMAQRSLQVVLLQLREADAARESLTGIDRDA